LSFAIDQELPSAEIAYRRIANHIHNHEIVHLWQ